MGCVAATAEQPQMAEPVEMRAVSGSARPRARPKPKPRVRVDPTE